MVISSYHRLGIPDTRPRSSHSQMKVRSALLSSGCRAEHTGGSSGVPVGCFSVMGLSLAPSGTVSRNCTDAGWSRPHPPYYIACSVEGHIPEVRSILGDSWTMGWEEVMSGARVRCHLCHLRVRNVTELSYAVLDYVWLCYVRLFYFMLGYTVLGYAVLFYVTLC